MISTNQSGNYGSYPFNINKLITCKQKSQI